MNRIRPAWWLLAAAVACATATEGVPASQHLVIRSEGLRAGDLRVPEVGVAEARAALGAGARVTETDHFVVVSDAEVVWTRRQERLLERAHDEYMQCAAGLGGSVWALDEKVVCVMIGDHDRFKAFARAQDGVMASWVAGYYATATNRIVFSDERGSAQRATVDEQLAGMEDEARELDDAAATARRGREGARAESLAGKADRLREHAAAERARIEAEREAIAVSKAVHEAVHALAFNTGLQSRARSYPFWLTEGLAVSFETADVGVAFGPGHAVVDREAEFAAAMGDGALLPLEVLVSLEQPPDSESAAVMYAQSYALFRWMWRSRRESLAGYFADIAAEPAGRIGARRHLEMFESRFGAAGEVERAWLAFEGSQGVASR